MVTQKVSILITGVQTVRFCQHLLQSQKIKNLRNHSVVCTSSCYRLEFWQDGFLFYRQNKLTQNEFQGISVFTAEIFKNSSHIFFYE